MRLFMPVTSKALLVPCFVSEGGEEGVLIKLHAEQAQARAFSFLQFARELLLGLFPTARSRGSASYCSNV